RHQAHDLRQPFAKLPASPVQPRVANKKQHRPTGEDTLCNTLFNQAAVPPWLQATFTYSIAPFPIFVRPVRLTPQVNPVVKKNHTVDLHTVADKVVNHER
ncbi:MAG: hypothetical protein L0G86_15060, partial [Pseudomonas sp.]|nr:hypothetical protein [Pseudomonas sp.]